MQIITKKIETLKPYKRNPRKNDKAIELVAASIKEFGFKVPIVIDTAGEVIAGHTRLKAAKRLGLIEVPCIVADDLTPDQIKAFRLADNKTAEFSEWDSDLLDIELDDIDLDMSAFGFELSNFGWSDHHIEDEIPEIEEGEAAITQVGDVWELGRHRLMCGDSTDKTAVRLLMNGDKADMVFTDPPYGVGIKGGKGKTNIMGDLTQTAITFSFEIAVNETKEKAHFYFCGCEGNIQLYQKLFDRFLSILPKHIIWVKNGFVMKQFGYHYGYEIIYHGYKTGSGAIWYGGRTEAEASDVWHVDRDASNKYLHPTQKPIELPSRAIKNSSPPNGTVLDLFGGSGSTLIACEQLGRKCYMMELDPQYCDVIIKRWEALTGEKAVRKNGT